MLTQLWEDGYTQGLNQPATVLERQIVATAVGSLATAWLAQISRTTVVLMAKLLVAGVASLMSDERALTIAKTEFSRAFNQARMDEMVKDGVTLVNWVTTSADPCQWCIDNREASPHPFGVPFPSGAMCPPDHPNCQCYIERA